MKSIILRERESDLKCKNRFMSAADLHVLINRGDLKIKNAELLEIEKIRTMIQRSHENY